MWGELYPVPQGTLVTRRKPRILAASAVWGFHGSTPEMPFPTVSSPGPVHSATPAPRRRNTAILQTQLQTWSGFLEVFMSTQDTLLPLTMLRPSAQRPHRPVADPWASSQCQPTQPIFSENHKGTLGLPYPAVRRVPL